MLLEFRVTNYRSFREEQVFSLVASSDKSLPDNFQSDGSYQVLKGAGVYGANASGKSNLVRAIDTMRDMVLESMDYKPEGQLPITPFLLDKTTQDEPTEFEVSFIHEEIRFQYGFSALRSKIEKEWLYAFPGGKGKRQLWFERATKTEDWEFGSFLRGEKTKLRELTRDNALFLSVGAKFNHDQLTKIFKWFDSDLRVISRKTRFMQTTEDMIVKSDDDSNKYPIPAHEILRNILRIADFGIFDFNVRKIPPENLRFLKETSLEVREHFKRYPPKQTQFVHRNDKNGTTMTLPLHEESEGTQQFFRLLGPFLESLQNGYTVFFDEIESSLHPLLTRELIRLFFNPKNTKGAQLIFATHDTTLMDPELLRRDQVWFTEKNTEGATQLYSLAEFKGPTGKARKNEAMQSKYLAGKYGAIPILEAFSIHG